MSQTLRAQLEIRELIVSGVLRSGERLPELHMVERLGMSRTPVRMALVRLQEEGLLEALPSGGFAVRAFTQAEVFEAIEVRGTLEGLAARLAAERCADPKRLRGAELCLDGIDSALNGQERRVDIPAYIEQNARFHAWIVELSGSSVLARQLERAMALPFASPNALAAVQTTPHQAYQTLTLAQDQHRCVLAAIEQREGTRAEALMREHARISSRNLKTAFGLSRISAGVAASKVSAKS